jgi:uncharacterized protein YaiL (DUF2058 family)
MASSLQDQLLKAGLTNEKALKKAKKDKHPQQKVAKSERNQLDEGKVAAQKALADKADRDRELARQQNELAAQKAVAAQIRQMIEHNRIQRPAGAPNENDRAYNFVDGKTIKKLNLPQKLVDQLSWGQLAIVKLDDKYELIPAKAAKKISERDPAAVIALAVPQANVVAEDDPYADFQVPDDLMW